MAEAAAVEPPPGVVDAAQRADVRCRRCWAIVPAGTGRLVKVGPAWLVECGPPPAEAQASLF